MQSCSTREEGLLHLAGMPLPLGWMQVVPPEVGNGNYTEVSRLTEISLQKNASQNLEAT